MNGKIFNSNKNVLLAVIYRSPDSPLGLFNEQLEHSLLQIDKEKKVALLSGDFNCNTYRELSVNPVVTQDFINTFSSFNYHKLITQPTRIVRETGHIKSATLLDNIYVSNKSWEDGFTAYYIRMKASVWIIKRSLLLEKMHVFRKCLNIESSGIFV